jgi:hypothetical protein
VLPNYQDLRLLIPAKPAPLALAGLSLYTPFKRSAVFKKQLFSLLIRMGFGPIGLSDRLLLARRASIPDGSEPVGWRGFFQEVLGQADLELAFAVGGWPGHFRKTVVQLMTPQGQPLAYAKIADHAGEAEGIRQEETLLRQLEALSLGGALVPSVLYAGRRNSEQVLVLSTPSGSLAPSPPRLEARHIRFLAELFRSTAQPQVLVESECFAQLCRKIETLHGWAPSVWSQRWREGCRRLIRKSPTQPIPLGWRHGDFAPWNIYLYQGQLFVLDWENGQEQSIPLWDLFHFVLRTGVLIHQATPTSLVSTLLDPREALAPLISEYTAAVGIGREWLALLLLYYLCDASASLLDGFRKKVASPKDQLLLDTLSGMLDLV